MAPWRITSALSRSRSPALLVGGCGGGSANPGVARRRPASRAPSRARGSSTAATTAPRNRPRIGHAGSGGARVRRVHALQRRAALPGPEGRRRLPLSPAPASIPPRPRSRRRRRSARSSCHRAPAPATPPSAQTLAHFLTVAQCMRQHGVSEFPDPRTTAPSNPRAALGSAAA